VVYDDIMKTKPRTWARAFQKRGNYCEDVDNNFTESFNGSLNKAREKPFVAMLEAIRLMAMVRIAKRSVDSHTHTSKVFVSLSSSLSVLANRVDCLISSSLYFAGSCTPYVAKFLAKEHKFASTAKVSTSTNGMYEVKLGGGVTHCVCLKNICTCMKWRYVASCVSMPMESSLARS